MKRIATLFILSLSLAFAQDAWEFEVVPDPITDEESQLAFALSMSNGISDPARLRFLCHQGETVFGFDALVETVGESEAQALVLTRFDDDESIESEWKVSGG